MATRMEFFRTTPNCGCGQPMMFTGGGEVPHYACSKCGTPATTIYQPHIAGEPEPAMPMTKAEFLPQLAISRS